MPAPRATTTSAPSAVSFLTVSGVAATRGSPASVSRATATRMRLSRPRRRHAARLRNRGINENQEADDEGDVGGRARAAHQAGDRPEHGDEQDDGGQQPIALHPADGEAEQD